MESDPLQEVQELERRRLDVYRSQTPPRWAWPSLGVAVFAFLASYELRIGWVSAAAALGWPLFVGVWLWMINRRSGVQPRLRGMPKPLFGELVRFWVCGAAVAGVAVALGLTVSFVLAGAVAGAFTVVGGKYFDRRYRQRTDALVAALAPPRP